MSITELRSSQSNSVIFMILFILHIIANASYIGMGITILSLESFPCEKTYHMHKYLTLSVAFCFLTFVSYFLFSRVKDRETVRARATSLMVIHLGFFTWGFLTMQKLDSHCSDQSGPLLIGFHYATIFFHGVYFVLYCLHELKHPAADWTVAPHFSSAITVLDVRPAMPSSKLPTAPGSNPFPSTMPPQLHDSAAFYVPVNSGKAVQQNAPPKPQYPHESIQGIIARSAGQQAYTLPKEISSATVNPKAGTGPDSTTSRFMSTP